MGRGGCRSEAWQEFDDHGRRVLISFEEVVKESRMKESDFRDRVVDVIEEPLGFSIGFERPRWWAKCLERYRKQPLRYYKFTLIMREHAAAGPS